MSIKDTKRHSLQRASMDMKIFRKICLAGPSSGSGPVSPHPSYAGDPRTGCSSTGGVSLEWSRETITSFDLLPTLLSCIPGYGGLCGHIAVSCSAFHPSAFSSGRVLLLRACSHPFSAKPVFVLAIAPIQVQNLTPGLVELQQNKHCQYSMNVWEDFNAAQTWYGPREQWGLCVCVCLCTCTCMPLCANT